jgi:iron complex outermembrane receptor protein
MRSGSRSRDPPAPGQRRGARTAATRTLHNVGAVSGLLFAFALSAPTSALAQSVQLNLPADDLTAELGQLARAAGIELLFDRSLVVQRRGAPVVGSFTPSQALTRALAGTGLTFRRSFAGAYVVVAESSAPLTSARPTSSAPTPAVDTISELLVTGSRSLNADVPRRRDDIQPYQVFGAEEIATSQAQTVEEFLRTRLTDDTAFPASIQEPNIAAGNATSQLNLRGLGLDQTLVLVDGRRLPSTSLQPDLNGIPPSAIERIEVLTSTAGGIYGPGAMGGVINIVLKRDIQGAELEVSAGETTRGDAPEWQASATFGGQLPVTGGQVMISASHAESDGLDFGDRPFVQQALNLARTRRGVQFLLPVASQVNVVSLDGNPLTLVTTLGGQSLGAQMTHLPLSVALAGGPAEAAAARANAGAFDQSLSPDGQGAEQSLVTATESNGLIASLRQPIGSRLEAFVDLEYFDERGAARVPSTDTSNVMLSAGAPGNPFTNDLVVSFPTPGLSGRDTTQLVTERATVGVIAHLGANWSGELDLTAGRAIERDRETEPGAPLSVTPFSGATAFASALAANQPERFGEDLQDRFSDINLRLGGPLLQLPAGAVTLTLLGEVRSDRPPFLGSLNIDAVEPTFGDVPSDARELIKQDATSLYAELRIPLVARDSDWILARSLELQAAVRGDQSTIRDGSPSSFSFTSATESSIQTTRIVQSRVTTAAVTLGASVAPAPGLMLRASVATGYLPLVPSPVTNSETDAAGPFTTSLNDPRRGGATVGAEGPVTLENLGDPNPKPELARTASLGAVLTPGFAPGLRVSVDYTRTVTSDGQAPGITTLQQYLLDHENQFPARIQRAPLTAADAALGFTGGVVTTIDWSTLDKARSIAGALHVEVDERRSWGAALLKFYARATWQPHLRFQTDPSQPWFDTAGFSDGPLTWRANFGADWTLAPWSAGANVQVFDGYREAVAQPFFAVVNDSNLMLQGASTIPAQVYVDLYVSYRMRLRFPGLTAQPVELRLGVENIFNQTPPLVVAAPIPFETVGYSTYGDARGRRFLFTAKSRF